MSSASKAALSHKQQYLACLEHISQDICTKNIAIPLKSYRTPDSEREDLNRIWNP
jgi:hypothetical protein